MMKLVIKKKRIHKVICKMLVAFLVAGMVLPVIPGGGEKMVYAETTSPNPNNWVTPLTTSTGGKQLTQGFYYVEPNTTVSCTNSTWGGNGITIANNATVYIYIPEGSTLVATGTKGNSRTNGGGAGIYVPSSSTLIFLGNGTVRATGGAGADGAAGSGGGEANRNDSSEKMAAGSGGAGGAGGAGAGAGIGIKGGNGGTGGSGGTAPWDTWHEPIDGGDGSDGNSGAPASGSMGTVFKSSNVTVIAKGGGAGEGGNGGDAGVALEEVMCGDSYRAAAGGAGGGGGGGGYAGADIGTGGPGGAGGGGGAGSGYQWTLYYCGGGGGGGGAGGNGGAGGTRGQVDQFCEKVNKRDATISAAENGKPGTCWSGGDGDTRSHVWVKSTEGNETDGYSGYGGDGGSSNYTSPTTSSIKTIASDETSRYYLQKVFFDGVAAGDGGEQVYYTGRSGNTVTAPEYVVGENQYFIGWKVKEDGYAFSFYDSAADGEARNLLFDDVTFYQPGDVIPISSDTFGPVVLEPIVASSEGNKAVSDVLTIEPADFTEETEYYTYKVETLVNGNREDVGQITLTDDDDATTEESYLLSSGSGDNRGYYEYVLSDAELREEEEAPVFGIHAKGENTGKTVSANSLTQVSYKKLDVITRVDGEPSDWPGTVTLWDDAPVLEKQSTGTYFHVDLEQNVDESQEYVVAIDGEDSGYTVSYGETTTIDYSSVQVQIVGNVPIQDVVLKNKEQNISLPLTYDTERGAWTMIQQTNDVPYTIYVNGKETNFKNVAFDSQSRWLTLGVYSTIFKTYIDGVATDLVVDDIYLGTQLTQRIDVGTYESVHVVDSAIAVSDEDSTYHVNSRYGDEDAMTPYGQPVDLHYYTVKYNGGSETVENVPEDDSVYRDGATVTLMPVGDMTNLGKTFTGWMVENTLYDVHTDLTINNTMAPTACWDSIDYNISYDMNDTGEDGSDATAFNPNVNLTSYTVDDEITLQNPTREGCIFMGWTYEGMEVEDAEVGMVPVKDLTIPAGHIGDMTFVAHWSVNQYTIDVDISEYDFGTRVNGYTNNPTPVTITVTNVGNQTVTINSINSKAVDEEILTTVFNCSGISKRTLAVGETATFTICPKANTAEGVYDEMVTITTTQSTHANVNVKFLVGEDSIPPTLTVGITPEGGSETEWDDFSENISSDVTAYGKNLMVNIDATDAETGVEKVEYYLAKEPMTMDQLEDLSADVWTAYTAGFEISANKEFVLYARAYDKEDPANVAWVSTSMLEIDTIAPVIKGVEDGVYYGETTFTVEDANLEAVRLNGSLMTPDANGVYTIPIEKGIEKTLTAQDSLGNTTTVILTVNNEKFDVTYMPNTGEGTMNADAVESGESLTLPVARFTAPDDNGATMEFSHWELEGDGSEYQAGNAYTVTGDVTFIAQWKYKEYDITYDLQGGEFAEGVSAPVSYATNESVTVPQPERMGYDFAGWTWESQSEPVAEVVIARGSNTKYQFTAHWTESDKAHYVVNHWKQDLNNEYVLNETQSLEGTSGEEITPQVASYEGFISPATITVTLNSKQEITVDYYYAREAYSYEVLINDKKVCAGTDKYDSIITVSLPRKGYKQPVVSALYASDGSELTDYDDYNITSDSDNHTINFNIPANGICIKLQSELVEYTIDYDLAGGTLVAGTENPTSYTVEMDEFYLVSPQREGYTFNGWTYDGQNTPVKTVLVNTTGAKNLSYTANWTAKADAEGAYRINHYQMTLDGTTYELVESEMCYGTVGENVTPDTKSYNGFTAPAAASLTVSDNSINTVDYQYSRNIYTLTLNNPDDIEVFQINAPDLDPNADGYQVYYQTPITISAILPDGYEAVEYQMPGAEICYDEVFFTMPYTDITIEVRAIKRDYHITYNLAEGTFSNAVKESYNIGDSDYTVPQPTRTGYDFAGWTAIINGASTDVGSSYTIDADTCADIVLNARWTPTNVSYMVKHMKENPDGSGYTEVVEDTVNETAVAGTTIMPDVKNYTGYVSPVAVSAVVKADGTTVVEYKYERIDYTIDTDEQNSENKDQIQDMIDAIDQLLNDPNSGLTEGEKAAFEQDKEALQNILNKITEAESNISEIEDAINNPTNNPSIEEVTSDDKANIQDLIDDIDKLLDANPNYLSEEEKEALLDKRSELTDKMNQIEETEDALENVENTLEYLPAIDETNSDDKDNLENALEIVEELLEDSDHLTDEQKQKLEDEKEAIQEKLDKIEEVTEELDNLQTRDEAINKDSVTSDDVSVMEDLINDLKQSLSDNGDNMTDAEKQDLKDRVTELQNELNNLEQLQEDMENIDELYTSIPDADDLTTEDIFDIQNTLDQIENLLNSNGNHLNDTEKQELEQKRDELEAKKEVVEAIQDKLNFVNDTVAQVEIMEFVSSDDKEAIEEAKQVIEDLLANDSNHLTDAEKEALQDTYDDLETKEQIIEEVENAIEEAESAQEGIPAVDEVKENDRDQMNDAIDKLEDLLDEDTVGNLSDSEKTKLQNQLDDLKDKIEQLDNAAEAATAAKNAIINNGLPQADVITTDNLDEVTALYEQLDDLINNYGGNMTDADLIYFETMRDAVKEKYDNASRVDRGINFVNENIVNLPASNDDLTSSDYDIIDQMITEIEDMLENYDGNLKDDQKIALQEQLEILQAKKDILQSIAEQLENIEDAAEELPASDSVTSDDKKAVEDLIEEIEDVLSGDSGKLSDADRAELEDLKEELETALDKLAQIQEDLQDMREAVTDVPSDEKLTSDNKAQIQEMISEIDQYLAENRNNLSEEEKDELGSLRNTLLSKVAYIENQEYLQRLAYINSQSPDSVTSNDKETVEDLIEEIEDILSDDSGKLSDTDRAELQELKEELEAALDKLAQIQKDLQDMREAVTGVPSDEQLTSDNKAKIQEMISEIDQYLAENGNNLNEDEKNELGNLRNTLSSKMAYIENQEYLQHLANSNVQRPSVNPIGDEIDITENVKVNDYNNQDVTQQEQEDENGFYTVEIYRGQTLIKRITNLTRGQMLDIADVEDGIYTIVTTNGDYIDTRMLIVEDGKSNISTVRGVSRKETEVRFAEEKYRMAIEGLDRLFGISAIREQVNVALRDGGSCTIRFEIQDPKDEAGVAKVNDYVKATGHKVSRIFDFMVTAYICSGDGSETIVPISDTEELLLVALPLEEDEKGKANYYVYRSHVWENGDEIVELLPELTDDEKLEPTGEGYYVEGDFLYIWASKYSLYALAYDDVTNNITSDIEIKESNTGLTWVIILLAGIVLTIVVVTTKVYLDKKSSRLDG